MADGLVLGVMVVAPLINFGLNSGAGNVPPQNYFAANTTVERLYKENGQVVATPIMDAAATSAACPYGSQVARQRSRVDGSREYLVWDLRCRPGP
jgi:hypothetical protein